MDLPPGELDMHLRSRNNKILIASVTLFLNLIFCIGIYFNILTKYNDFIYCNLYGLLAIFINLQLFHSRTFARTVGVSIFISTILYTLLNISVYFSYYLKLLIIDILFIILY
jgi:hypothetical protein